MPEQHPLDPKNTESCVLSLSKALLSPLQGWLILVPGSLRSDHLEAAGAVKRHKRYTQPRKES